MKIKQFRVFFGSFQNCENVYCAIAASTTVEANSGLFDSSASGVSDEPPPLEPAEVASPEKEVKSAEQSGTGNKAEYERGRSGKRRLPAEREVR